MGADGRNRAIQIAILTFASIGAPYVLLQSAGSTLFLLIHGPESLPQVYLWVGLFTGALVWLFGQLGAHLNPRRVLVTTLLARAAVAVGLKAAASLGYTSEVAFAAAVWSRVDILVGGLSLWTYTRRMLGGEQARQAVPLLSGFEYAAMMIIGLLIPAILPLIVLTDLFTMAAFSLCFAAAPLTIADRLLEGDRRRYRRPEVPDKRKRRALSPSFRRYYIAILLVVLGFVLCHYMLDQLYFTAIATDFASPVEMASFISYALTAAGLVGVVMAGGGGAWVIQRFNAQSGLVGLPFALIIIAGLMSLSLWFFGEGGIFFAVIVIAKVCERGVLHGFYRPSFETLFQPLPQTHRVRAFGEMEMIFQPAASIAAALTLIALDQVFGYGGANLAFMLMFFAAFWVITVAIARQGYVGALQRALTRRQSLEAVSLGSGDRRSREIIQNLMNKGNMQDTVDSARVQAALDPDGFANMAPRLIARGDGEVVRRLLTTIPQVARPEFYPPMAGRLTVEEDPALRNTLLTAAAATRHPNSPRLLAKAIADDPDNPPIGALIGLGRDGGDYGAAISGQFLEKYALTGQAALAHTLEAITKIGPQGPSGPVAEGLRSDDRRIRQSAIRAAGKAPDPGLAPLLVERLGNSRDRRAATLALTSMGAKAIPAIARVAGDRDATLGARSAAIMALGGLDEADAYDQIFRHVESPNVDIRAAAHLALWRAGVVVPGDLAPGIMESARNVMRNGVEAALAAISLKALDNPLLDASLRQRIDLSITRAIRAAGLLKPRPPGGRSRLGGYFGNLRDHRYAMTLANDLLPHDLAPVLASLTAPDQKAEAERLAGYISQPARDAEDWLAHILSDAHWSTDWLQSLALSAIAAIEPDEAHNLTERLKSPGPALSNVIETLDAARRGEKAMALSTIEKVLILKSADLFHLVPDEDLAEVASHMESLYLDPDEVVIRQGDIGDELYILVSGAVRVEIDGTDVGAMPEGAVFGDLAALDPEPRAATIITTEPSHALVLSNEHLMGLFESNVEIAAGVISTLVRRLRKAPPAR